MTLDTEPDPWQSRLMLGTLKPHSQTPSRAVDRIDVEIGRGRRGQLAITYRLSGRVGDIRLPPLTQAGRADDLWRHTCFEVFIKTPGSQAYCEFNFSTSGCWAAYGFDDTRLGMRNLNVAAPSVALQVNADDLTLTATFDLAGMGPKSLAVCAVIEEAGGQMSYWALTHPGKRPDFHRPDGFVLDLPALEQT